MADAVITEYAGTKKGAIIRYYQYGSGGVRVLDAGKNLCRLYLFDHAADMMTERDPARQEKILRRFMFDRYGMLEETFAFGQPPRTFRYENGGRQIAVREGGQYGAVGTTFTFEEHGISETAWGRHGEIERVYIFEDDRDTITERTNGWFGTVDRTFVFEGIDASVFREPEAFLQFLVFTERRGGDADAVPESIRADTGRRAGPPLMAKSRFAFTGKRIASNESRRDMKGDSRIDFIPDGDAPDKEPDREKTRPKKSSLVIDGVEVASLNERQRTLFRLNRLGYVFQNYALVPELTAEENIYLPSKVRGMTVKECTRACRDILSLVGLKDRVNFLPGELSGGEQQRVAIARALVNKPSIILADEPCANLDTQNSRVILELIKKLNKELSQTIVMVSHEDWHKQYFDRIITMMDGKIIPGSDYDRKNLTAPG